RPSTGHARRPERPLIGPLSKDVVESCVGEGRGALGVVRPGQTLPRPPGSEPPQDAMQAPGSAPLAPWAALGPREGRQEQCGALRCGEWDRNRGRGGLLSREA